MKKSTFEYYKAVINRALAARESIGAAKSQYDRDAALAKSNLEDGILGEAGYKDLVARLGADRDAKTEGALSSIDEAAGEFYAEMQELGRLDGARIDDGVVKLLNSGIRLTTQEWQELADAHKDNFLTTRVLKEKYSEAKSREGGGLGFVQFGQSPHDRQAIFEKFAKTLRNECTIRTPGIGAGCFASHRDYINFLAKDSLKDMQPFGDDDFGTIDKDFPVELVSNKKGNAVAYSESSGFGFGFASVR